MSADQPLMGSAVGEAARGEKWNRRPGVKRDLAHA